MKMFIVVATDRHLLERDQDHSGIYKPKEVCMRFVIAQDVKAAEKAFCLDFDVPISWDGDQMKLFITEMTPGSDVVVEADWGLDDQKHANFEIAKKGE